jgi:hypothetical protein
MDANEYYLRQFEVKATRDIKLTEILNKNAINTYEDWVREGAPLAEILAGLWDITDNELIQIQQALQNNNYELAGKAVLTTVKRNLMHAAMITANESQRTAME